MKTTRVLGVLAVLVAACGQPAQNQKPLTPDLTDGEWNEIPGGEGTECARGTPFSFFAYEGTQNKVVLDFIGGGACWTYESCALGAGQLFSDDIDDLLEYVDEGFPGVYDKTLAGSPFEGWYHVIVPYCTGDIHWGDRVTTYESGDKSVTIHHKGAVNTRAVLRWLFENFPDPESVLVTGCSAGSYGSILWAPYVKRQYPNAHVVQMGDSGAGVITESFFLDSFPQWNAFDAAPSWIPTLDPAKNDWATLELADLYARVGAFYPDMVLSQFNTRLDETQSFFFSAMGGSGGSSEWSRRMLASLKRTHELTPQFRSFIAEGKQHCILPEANVTSLAEGDVKFAEWLRALMDGEPVDDVACPDCKLPGN